nr:MAG TPA: hypothetical protein [Caudoviricetes sp.]
MAKKHWQTGDIVEAEDLNRLETATQPVTSDSDGLMSKNDKTKLDSIESGAQKNPDTVSTTKNGLMSANDKTKLDSIESGAQKNPNKANQAESEAGTDDSKYMTAIRVKQSILKNTPLPSKVTAVADGLMSKEDKNKLDEIEAGATKNTATTDSTSTSNTLFFSAQTLKNYMRDTRVNRDVAGYSAISDIPESTGSLPGLVRGIKTNVSFNDLKNAIANIDLGYYYIGNERDCRLDYLLSWLFEDVDNASRPFPAFPSFPIHSVRIYRPFHNQESYQYGLDIQLNSDGGNLNLMYRTNSARTIINEVRFVGRSFLYSLVLNGTGFNAESIFDKLLKPPAPVGGVGFEENVVFTLIDPTNGYTYEMLIGKGSTLYIQKRTSFDESVKQIRKYNATNNSWGSWTSV